MRPVRTALPVLVGIAALTLSACSSSSDGSSAATSSVATSAAAESAAVTAGVTSYILPGTGVFPEGITAYQNTFYVTSTANAAVFKGEVGSADVQPFLAGGSDGRTGAVGVKVTADGSRLLIAGGMSGTVSVYDTSNGTLVAGFTNGLGPDATFINDITLSSSGDAYITDSRSPFLYRISADQIKTGTGASNLPLDRFVDFTGSPFVYGAGFNANGIVTTPDDSAVDVVQSSSGNLYRVGIADKAVTQVNLGGAALTNGDGMRLDGSTLYVVRNMNGVIAKVDLAADGTSGSMSGEVTDPSFKYPTGAAVVGDQLLVVNSQFDKRGGTPVEPFTVSAVAK